MEVLSKTQHNFVNFNHYGHILVHYSRLDTWTLNFIFPDCLRFCSAELKIIILLVVENATSFFLYSKTVQPKKKIKKYEPHDAFWNWLFSLIPYTRQIIISKHVCCIWEHLRSLVVLARSALSISIHKASHYQVFISLRSETDYSLQQRAQITKLIDRRWPGIHYVL